MVELRAPQSDWLSPFAGLAEQFVVSDNSRFGEGIHDIDSVSGGIWFASNDMSNLAFEFGPLNG